MTQLASIRPVRTPRDATLTMRGFPFGAGDTAVFRVGSGSAPNWEWRVLGLIDHDGLAAMDKRSVIVQSAIDPDHVSCLPVQRFGWVLRAVNRNFTVEWAALRQGGDPQGAVVRDARGRVFWKDEQGLCKSKSDLNHLEVLLQRAKIIDWSDRILTEREAAKHLAPIRTRADEVFAELVKQVAKVRYYGEIVAPGTERDLLVSLGAKVGRYLPETEAFPVDFEASALEVFERLGAPFLLRVEPLSEFEKHGCEIGEMGDSLLARYRTYLSASRHFDPSDRDLDWNAAVKLLSQIDREMKMRSMSLGVSSGSPEQPAPSF